MPRRSDFPPLPYLDPEFNPDHPLNHPLEDEKDEFWPLPNPDSTKTKLRKEKERMARAVENWTPPHVVRSWETDTRMAEQRTALLDMVLTPRLPNGYEDLGTDDPVINHTIREIQNTPLKDFRRYAQQRLHLGHHRFHASHGEPFLPSEELDNVPPEDICWIMEYTERECNTIRRKLAKLMGIFPATTDKDNENYDEEIAWRYERRLYVRCRRRNKQCIRPGHIIVFTSSFLDLP